MSTSRNTGTNHKGKTVQTVNFVTFFHLFFSKLGYSQNTEHNHNNNIWACFLQFRYSGFAGCPWDTEQVAASLPPQISYPCWALQSNTERNLPSTFGTFSIQILSCSLRITFCFHEAENFKFVRIFNNIQIFKSHLHSSKLFGSLQAQHNSASF